METRKSYTCKSCGYKSKFPLHAEEVAGCHQMNQERLMNRLRLAIIIVCCIAVPIRVIIILAYL